EQGTLPGSSGVLKLALLNREGEKITCELTVPVDILMQYLTDRIGQGVHNFFSAMSKAFNGHPQERVHVLLAGNSRRSAIVQKLFAAVVEGSVKGEVEVGETLSLAIGSSTSMTGLLREAMRSKPVFVSQEQAEPQSEPVIVPLIDGTVPQIIV